MKEERGERKYVLELGRQLETRFGYEVYCHRRPTGSPRLRKYLAQRIGFDPILQPELDLVVRQKNGILSAIEVKLFRRKQKNYSTPFYEGIGQALALLGYGFDHVALWYLFRDEDLEIANKAYGASTWHFIRNKIQLPLDFSFFGIRESESKIRFDVMKYLNEHEWKRLIPLDDSRFRITWKHDNPIRNTEPASTIRKGLDLWLLDQLPSR